MTSAVNPLKWYVVLSSIKISAQSLRDVKKTTRGRQLQI